MDQLLEKLKELENARECVEKYQTKTREEMSMFFKNDKYDQFVEKEQIYFKNKAELKEINKKIEILNNAMDILEGIGD